MHKDLLTPGLTQVFWIPVQKNMVLTPLLSVKDTCFYTEPIKGSSFVITKKIMKLLMHSCTAIPQFYLFWFGRHLLIFKIFIRLLSINFNVILRHTIQYSANKSASFLCPVTYIEKCFSKNFTTLTYFNISILRVKILVFLLIHIAQNQLM